MRQPGGVTTEDRQEFQCARALGAREGDRGVVDESKEGVEEGQRYRVCIDRELRRSEPNVDDQLSGQAEVDVPYGQVLDVYIRVPRRPKCQVHQADENKGRRSVLLLTFQRLRIKDLRVNPLIVIRVGQLKHLDPPRPLKRRPNVIAVDPEQMQLIGPEARFPSCLTRDEIISRPGTIDNSRFPEFLLCRARPGRAGQCCAREIGAGFVGVGGSEEGEDER